MRRLARALTLAATLLLGAAGGGACAGFATLEPGLEYGEFALPIPDAPGDAVVKVIRIDPSRLRLRVYCAAAPEEGGKSRTLRQWAHDKNLVAVVNASMYQADERTAVSLLRTPTYVNQKRVSKDKAVLLFDPQGEGLPPVRIVDRTCENLVAILPRYGSAVQSIRMLSCTGENTWVSGPERWSVAAVGMDVSDHVLLLHTRAPVRMSDWVEALRALPLGLKRLQYAEGGHPAQMLLRAGGRDQLMLGVSADAETEVELTLPNVLGVERIPPSK